LFHEELHDRYEDGTVNFLGIIALDHAFDVHERLYENINNVGNHVATLSIYLHREMSKLRHWNKTPVCTLHSDRDYTDSARQGSIVCFNLLRSDGSWIDYNEVIKLAGIYKISIRGGGHCNTGSVARWHSLTAEEQVGE